ncbi:hypothetical protein SEA_PUPPER_166 [Gordonia phage Pupper]|uniref:Capsid decoration protein n=1 Tax=Gordonia phage Pupper TaxID=2571249 RepID=A0A4Y6EJK1_9CAUD|nr:virion structural protein [Gordonia phage Pupper]QDF18652.1 hypothetical protein SEA_PUPPER_166 [Gordonia phage Pupper]
MAVQRRALTFNFQRAVTIGEYSRATVLEVAVAPLSSPSSSSLDATLVGGPEVQEVVLSNTVEAVFYLVPTDDPSLTERVTYRAAWRDKYMGRQHVQDFVMPDFDVDFDDLQNLGQIIGGETYVQWSDRMRPGGIAALNELGQVVDYEGNVVNGAAEAAIVQGNLNAEIVARQQGDASAVSSANAYTLQQVGQVYSTTAAQLSSAVSLLQNADLTERSARQSAVNQLNASLAQLQASISAQLAALQSSLGTTNGALNVKADLVGGKIPTSQLPDITIGRAVAVAGEEEMLALTSAQVQQGDFAVRPDGVWFLNGSNPAVIGNWVKFNSAGAVASVNGKTGSVVLTAADVNARPTGTPIPQNEITGLSASLAAKANTSTTSALSSRIGAIETDPTLVRTVDGEILRSVSGDYLVYLDDQLRLTTKDGSLINIGGGGGIIAIPDVTGLQAALDGKLDAGDQTNPLPHSTTHGAAGSDPILISQNQVSGLAAILSNNQLSPTSAHEARIAALETSGGGGGGGGEIAKANWFNGLAPYQVFDPADLQTVHGVTLRGPFSENGAGQFAYSPDGVAPAGHAYRYAYITPNGHLELREWNEDNPPDDDFVPQSALDATNAQVATKASQASVTALTGTVNGKADTSALNALTTAVGNKVEQSEFATLQGVVSGKADATTVAALQAAVNGKASDAALTALTATVGTKANLVSGTVPLAEIPNLPVSKITSLADSLAAKADLASGTVPLNQIPNLTVAKVTGLQSALDGKASLVDGKVPTSQIPNLALTNVVTVVNKAAMLALTSDQVQPGDVCVINQAPDIGSYILSGTNPSIEGNWVKLASPSDVAVLTVNGQSGVVVLGAADVGARPAGGAIAISEITNLQNTLNAKADNSAMTTALAGKTSPADVQTTLTQSQQNKLLANLVSTAAIATLSGQQSIDGVLAPLNSRVLLTAQSSSAANGLYVVNSGAWTRVADMAAGSFFVRGTTVMVSGGTNNANTFWQITSDSGLVGTNANNWTKVMTAGAPIVYTGSLGVAKVGNDFRAQVVSGGGITATASGLQLDPNVASRKVALDVPAGGPVVTIVHNLNTQDVDAAFRDKAAGDAVLLGWRPTGPNTISAEFSGTVAAGQYRVTIFG